MTRMSRAAPLAWVTLALATGPGCKGSKHARVASFVPRSSPRGSSRRAAPAGGSPCPSTWKDAAQKGTAAWAVADPQAVDDFQASANVLPSPSRRVVRLRESERGRAAHDPHASVEVANDDVVDGDPTLVIESRWSPTPPSTATYRTMQTALSSRGTGYVVTCAASASSFERYRSTCESIVRSFAVER